MADAGATVNVHSPRKTKKWKFTEKTLLQAQN